ncbi:ABC transporter permease, partial [Candidatus Cerribacteria bacterium 'Amazon FNV 2010 28 9']
LIGLYISHELSYDKFHKNASRIVRLTTDYNFGDAPRQVAFTGTKAGPQFKRTFPSVQAFTRTYKRTRIVTYADKLFDEKNFLYADSSFFRIFSFPLLQGDISSALNAPGKIVVTQNIAQKYFGSEKPVGKILKVGDVNFEVTGVTKDFPSNSQIQFDFAASFSSLDQSQEEKWMDANYVTYLLIDNERKIASLQNQVAEYMQNVSKNEFKVKGGQYLTYHLEPLTSVHLHSQLSGFEPNSNVVYIYVLVAIAILILIIACVNYVNLAVAQSSGRTAEISMHKILGAVKRQIFSQFIGESFFITSFAAVLAVCVALLALPFFNALSGKQFSNDVLFSPFVLLMLLLLCAVVSLAAGMYPALLISNVKLVKLLKSGFSFSSGGSVRKSLIIFQFIISIFLVTSTLIISQQLNFLRNKDLGYNKNNVVVLPLDDKTSEHYDAFKSELNSLQGVQHVTATRELVNSQWIDGIKGENAEEITVNAIPCDEDFVKTMELKLIAGTDFTRADVMQMDTSDDDKNLKYSFMLNESATKALGWKPEEAIGRSISKGVPGTVKAVVKDFHFHSLHEPITPLVVFLDSRRANSILVKILPDDVSGTLNRLKKTWNERVTHRPFEYHFLNEDYEALYKTERQTAAVFTTFSVLAIFLACLGLFALTAFAITQRGREIGIRKVLGASVLGLVKMLSGDFLKLVLISIFIATPLAWYFINKWLRDFAYRIPIHWWVFIAAGIIALLIAMMTVSIQSVKAAIVKPVKSLRTE